MPEQYEHQTMEKMEELQNLYKTKQLSKQGIRYHLVMVMLTHLITCNFIKENTSIRLRFFVKKRMLACYKSIEK